jgi:filamentous hemagglutinin family protein
LVALYFGWELVMKTYRTFLTLTALLSSNFIYAQAITDGSMGATQTLSGQFTVPATLGTTSGANLFHSFKTFNINSGESATFTGPNTILNVITRVTGGEVSTINGLLRSEVGNANFYFINPTGIIFGAEAKVDVPAAFHAGAVDSLRFVDGTHYTMSSQVNSLSISAPENFGLTTATLANNGMLSADSAVLSVNNKQTLDLAAEKIVFNHAQLSAKEGNVKLTATNMDAVSSKISTDTSGIGNAGDIDINAKNMNLIDTTQLSADSNGTGKGGQVFIHDAEKVSIQNGSLISANSNAEGSGGVVTINAKNINLDGKNLNTFTGIAANAKSTGQAGQVNVQASTLTIQGGAEMNSSTFGAGDANSVNVVAEELTIDGKNNTFGPTGIGSRANPNSSGQAGSIIVTANSINLINGGAISSATSSTGNAGAVNVNVNTLHIDGQNNLLTPTGIDSSTNSAATGTAGLVDVKVYDLVINNAGGIGSNSFGSGNAGTVQIQADTIDINGKGAADSAFTGISSNTFGSGNAGNVNVIASSLALTETGRIASNTTADGNAGDVTIVAGNLHINGNNSAIYTGIASNTYYGKGNAGTVDVTASKINIENAGRITTNTRGSGKAGNLFIQADDINIDAKNSEYLAGIASAASPESTGQIGNIHVVANNKINLSNDAQISIQNRGMVSNGEDIPFGQIDITTPNLTLEGNSVINAQSTQNADASNINMHIANVLQMNMSSISTEANSGNGGAIHLDTGNYMNLMQSSITTTVKSSIGNGGDITVSTPALILDNGMVQANAVSGRGGDVFIDVKSLIGSQSQLIQGGDVPLEWKNTVPGFNIIQAASKFGLSGTVNVTSPQMDLSGVLIGLSTSSFGRDLLSQDYCAIGAGSSLTVRGYGILPPTASDLMY